MKETNEKKHKNHSLISAILVTLVLLVGLSLLLYPTAADYINSLDYKKDIEHYQRQVQDLDDSQRQAILEAAQAWNRERLDAGLRIGALNETQQARYAQLLNPVGTGIMGYVEIPKIGVYLPVYHGTQESALQAGVGHLEGSSLPVGGIGTHAILSGHTGLPSSKLFSNIDQLQVGDTFSLHVLGETLLYQVESTEVMLPEEAEKQRFDPERDLCTLITCTPYGVNSHRLLVRGVRIETPQQERPSPDAPVVAEVEDIPAPVPPVLIAAAVGVPLLLAIAIITAVVRRKKRRK